MLRLVRMRAGFVLVACASFLGASDAFKIESGEPFVLVHGETYLGAIVPEGRDSSKLRFLQISSSGYWTPTPESVAKLEDKLKSALERGQQKPEMLVQPGKHSAKELAYVAGEIGSVLENLPSFRRQYVGLIMKDGTRRILVNAFPGAEKERERFPYWRQGIVWVDDGGFWYWRIQYDLETGTFSHFDSNGYG